MDYAQKVLRQRQADGWMPPFPIYPDICKLDGEEFAGSFDVLCGGFPCQAFSSAAHGKNIASKNLWNEMFRFARESNAPVVFGENVVLRAIEHARADLESVGYKVERIRLGNVDLGADHRRFRFWLMAVRDDAVFSKVANHVLTLPKLTGRCWENSPKAAARTLELKDEDKCRQLVGVGNAQSPLVAATAFRILVNRLLSRQSAHGVAVSADEIAWVYEKRPTWMQNEFGGQVGLVHTPTTIANYCCDSMQKHASCRNYVRVFGDGQTSSNTRPSPTDAEYLMGFPIGASCPHPLDKTNIQFWKGNEPC